MTRTFTVNGETIYSHCLLGPHVVFCLCISCVIVPRDTFSPLIFTVNCETIGCCLLVLSVCNLPVLPQRAL